MRLDIEKEIKIYWTLGIIVLLIYGLWLFISVESYHVIMGGGPYFSPSAGRIIGGIYISWAIIIIILYKDIENWEKLESWMIFAVLTNILTAIAQILGTIMYNISISTYIIGLIINIIFAIVGIHIILQKRK